MVQGVTYLIQQAQLARFGLLICWVQEDATIQQGAVHICHHAAHIPQALGLLVCWVLALMHIPASSQGYHDAHVCMTKQVQ